MTKRFLKHLSFSLILLVAASGCMTLDGSHGYRKKNKCCGVIKCDMHRAAKKRSHKRTVNAHKSLRKKEQRIKRGY